MSLKQEVRVGVIGVGNMGRTHIEALRDVERAKVVAVTDPANFADVGPKLAKEYGIDYEENIESLVSKKDIDAVVITTPHGLHCQHSVLALKHGKHVLVEKPMELTLEKCDTMIEAAEKRGLKLMVAHSHRYWEGDKIAKRLLEEGTIGKLVMCRDVLAAVPGYRKYDPQGKTWMHDLSLYGRGGLIAWGIHDIDRFRWWFEDEVDTVFATSLSFRTDIPGDLTSHMVTITFKNGGCAQLWYSETFPEPGWKGFSCKAELVGEKGLMDVESYNEVKVARKSTDKWETIYRIGDFSKAKHKTFVNEDRDFIKCIIDNSEPSVSGEDGRKAVEIVLAVYKSGDIGKAIKLP